MPLESWKNACGLPSWLSVSPATVTSMLKTLSESQLATYAPYEGVKLTPAGSALALRILRRHRLIELFLATTLDMTWNEEYSNEYQNADYAIIYVQQIQREAPKTLLDFLNQHEPEHTISINGLEYIWIYNLRELPEPEFVSR